MIAVTDFLAFRRILVLLVRLPVNLAILGLPMGPHTARVIHSDYSVLEIFDQIRVRFYNFPHLIRSYEHLM